MEMYLMKKASISLKINLKIFGFFEKPSNHFGKASILLKMSLKNLSGFNKASDF
jgi:hypothetical protein